MSKLFLVPFFLIVLAGCGGSDDDDDSGAAGESPGSCFYECNLGAGLTQYGCASAEDLADEDACYEQGRTECGANIGKTALLTSCDACDASCAPDWYHE